MNIRATQASTFNLVAQGISYNQGLLARAQQQIATGRRILAPSDDPIGTSTVLSLRRQLANVGTYRDAIGASQPILSTATSELQQASSLLQRVRELALQGMNGTNSPQDRQLIANEIDLLRQGLLDVGNAQLSGRYLFAGTDTTSPPFSEVQINGRTTVEYSGDSHQQSVLVGLNVEVKINISGAQLFGSLEPQGVEFAGLSGARPGQSANSGSGYHDLHLRHDATTGTLGANLAFVNGGADDSLLGDKNLIVDAAAGTVRLGSGPALPLPLPSSDDLSAYRVVDADGGELFLDFSNWSGASFSGTVHGDGSIALDGGAYVPLSFTETDLELVDEASGTVLHVDTTGIGHAGDELVTFTGATNLFDTLAGMARDLRNPDGASHGEMLGRINGRLDEFDRLSDNLLVGLGELGSRSARLDTAEVRIEEVDLHLKSVLSETEDVDLAAVVLEMTEAEQTLQVAQATGARLIQQSLLNYLR